jgi:hypothetical protein
MSTSEAEQPAAACSKASAELADEKGAPIAVDIGEHAQEVDPEVERHVLRKIDMFLMPAMVIGKLHLESGAHKRLQRTTATRTVLTMDQ